MQLPVTQARRQPERTVGTRGEARGAGGARIYWERSGRADGPPLLLIRGLGRSSSYWLEFRSILERERSVLVLDNRGVGRSESPLTGWTTATMADDVAAVLDASGTARLDVFGISLGGMIAQELALRHPDRVNRLVLACTTPGGRKAQKIRPAAAAALARSLTMRFDEAIRYTAPYVIGEAIAASRPEIVETWIHIAASEPRSRRGIAGQLAAGARHSAWNRLRRLELPTLVITGDDDRLMPHSNSQMLARLIAGARLKELRGAPHDFPTERPVETAEAVLDFLG
ncbi:MAG: alpha/beta fold hydrolase [Sandaracinaceae bacterium]